MATSFEVQDVKNFLQQRFITTSSEWVKACIDFLKQENGGQALPINVLKDSVYQQWLSADLEEIGVSALPNDLPTSQKVVLNGSYALQVNGIRDISKPAYSQLKELENNINSNEEFSSAPQASIPQWEAKPTRMLMLNLTDGCITVQGLENKPINFLSLSLPPGVKVLIHGPLDCRFGVFLLMPEKIKVLGGEVENKLEEFSQTSILRRILHLPTAEEPIENIYDPNIIHGVQNPVVTEDDSVSIISEHRNSWQDQLTTSNAGAQNNHWQQQPNTSFAGTLNSAQSRYSVTTNQNVPQSSFVMNTSEVQTRQISNQHSNLQNRENNDNLDAFEDDDDFVNGLDYGAIDELEKENSLNQTNSFEEAGDDADVWQEDEDVLRDLMTFQDENPGFDMPIERDTGQNNNTREPDSQRNLPFTYLSSALEKQESEYLVTIKGFIIKVLSKLECTAEKGWSLKVKINDGTATVEANMHDKVLENIIGLSAVEMVKKQKEAANDPEKRKEVMEAISKCKVTLQDYNCLMDIKFSSHSNPCVIKCHPITHLHIKQLLERTRSYF